MNIAPADREKYRHCTDGAIVGFKMVERLPDAMLLKLLDDPGLFERMRLKIGKDTNPNWLTARLAETAYERDLIDEQRLDSYA